MGARSGVCERDAPAVGWREQLCQLLWSAFQFRPGPPRHAVFPLLFMFPFLPLTKCLPLALSTAAWPPRRKEAWTPFAARVPCHQPAGGGEQASKDSSSMTSRISSLPKEAVDLTGRLWAPESKICFPVRGWGQMKPEV